MHNMKTPLLILLGAFIVSAQWAGAQGIAFEKASWADALAKAKTQNKIIFLDAYTTWCGPCKMMDKNTFTDPKVGQLYNATFVNMQVDMEKGEGTDIARRYGVNAYPTLLFINAEGQVVHRALGYRDAEQFLALGVEAADPAKNMAGLERRYAEGDRSPELMRALIEAKATSRDPKAPEMVNEYLAGQKDLNTPENRQVIFDYVNDPASPYFAVFMEHQPDYVKQFGKEEVASKKQMAVAQIARTPTPLTPDEAMPQLQKAFGKDAAHYKHLYEMMYYQRLGNRDAFASSAVAYFDKADDVGAQGLNEIAWYFFENVDDKDQLKHALKWAERSIALEEQYANLDTLAALHYKLGNTKDARKYAEKAIAKAKTTGEDYSSTEELLQKL